MDIHTNMMLLYVLADPRTFYGPMWLSGHALGKVNRTGRSFQLNLNVGKDMYIRGLSADKPFRLIFEFEELN